MKIKDLYKIEKIKGITVLATIINTKGSVPRNEMVNMVISEKFEFGTIGGGELEFQILKIAKEFILLKNKNQKTIEFPLGPSLGQCCGGFVKIELLKYNNGKDLLLKNNLENQILKNNKNLYIFGAGHVAKALISKLEGVGFNIFIVDSRKEFISSINQDYVIPILAKNNRIIINNSPTNSFYLIMTHSHKIDLDICSLLLNKNNFSFIGLIGSKTKKARFTSKLLKIGYSQDLINKIECPIGINTIKGKEPDIIAISIIAKLLEYKESLKNNKTDFLKLVKNN